MNKINHKDDLKTSDSTQSNIVSAEIKDKKSKCKRKYACYVIFLILIIISLCIAIFSSYKTFLLSKNIKELEVKYAALSNSENNEIAENTVNVDNSLRINDNIQQQLDEIKNRNNILNDNLENIKLIVDKFKSQQLDSDDVKQITNNNKFDGHNESIISLQKSLMDILIIQANSSIENNNRTKALVLLNEAKSLSNDNTDYKNALNQDIRTLLNLKSNDKMDILCNVFTLLNNLDSVSFIDTSSDSLSMEDDHGHNHDDLNEEPTSVSNNVHKSFDNLLKSFVSIKPINNEASEPSIDNILVSMKLNIQNVFLAAQNSDASSYKDSLESLLSMANTYLDLSNSNSKDFVNSIQELQKVKFINDVHLQSMQLINSYIDNKE